MGRRLTRRCYLTEFKGTKDLTYIIGIFQILEISIFFNFPENCRNF